MTPVIQLRDIEKVYIMGQQKLYALQKLSCDIFKGDFAALMGPSGSGKSTLMNIIGCLDTPTSGSYILNGTDVIKMNDNDLAEIRNKEIGFVFQTFNLLPRMNAIENVELPLIYAGISKKERTERAKQALISVGLENRMHHKPNELSGGQRQRVAIARALVNNPSILLADEPTGNLDSKSSGEILDLFDKIHAEGNTILMVTHEEDVSRRAKRVIRMIDGHIDNLQNNPETAIV